MSEVPNAMSVNARDLYAWLGNDDELALLDVRGQGAFSEKNLFHATTLPLGQLELLIANAVPRRNTRTVIVSAENDGLSERAVSRLRSFGYTNLCILAGGVEAWERAGYPVYSGTHVRSKAFSEVMEEDLHIPWIDASEMKRRVASGQRVVVFDSRSFPEYQRVTVPGATSIPGSELVRHIRDQVPDEGTLVVVSCGGRTRSIIGAQSLIAAGLPNPVVSLKDGTMGLRRDGLPMENGAGRRPLVPSEAGAQWGAAAAAKVAEAVNVRTIDDDTFRMWQEDRGRTLYVFDVRTPEEYVAGHLAGSTSAQGSQLVQEIDTYAPVWGARIVLVDDEHLIRARMTASWLLQLGCPEVAVRTLGNAPLEVGPQPLRVAGLQDLRQQQDSFVTVEQLADLLERDQANVVDLSTSPQYRLGHVPGAWFVTRVRLAQRLRSLPQQRALVLTSEDGLVARFAAAELAAQHGIQAKLLIGGNRGWQLAGRQLAQGPERINDDVDDAWLPPPQRDGDVHAAIVEYLEWELSLAHRVREDRLVRFKFATTARHA
jgi:rhodanese-related sulfurtransferase